MLVTKQHSTPLNSIVWTPNHPDISQNISFWLTWGWVWWQDFLLLVKFIPLNTCSWVETLQVHYKCKYCQINCKRIIKTRWTQWKCKSQPFPEIIKIKQHNLNRVFGITFSWEKMVLYRFLSISLRSARSSNRFKSPDIFVQLKLFTALLICDVKQKKKD